MIVRILVATALGLLYLHMHVTRGQQVGPCSQGLEQELPGQCLQSNGIDYNGTLFIISSNRSGSLPPGMTYDAFRDLMCSEGKKDQVTPCILQLMQKWNQSRCEDRDRVFMSARGSQLLALMEAFCGDACENSAMQTIIQCFAAVQIDPSSLLNQNASVITDKFDFVGNDTASATKFCNVRQRLFTCLSPLAKDCPRTIERLYTLGVDLAGMERATKVLCDDLDTYLQTLKCFTTPSPALRQCNQEVGLLFQQVQEERYRTGQTKPSQYQGRLCQTKLSKVDCELKKFADACGQTSTEMVSTFECTSMPKPCREGSETLPVYESICKKVTTPSPSLTPRPTPPKKPVNPGQGSDDGDDEGEDGESGGVVVVGSWWRALLCAAIAAVVTMLVGWVM